MCIDVLFINCWHLEFPYVPMGTFGLCDYLEKNGISSKIINLSLYSEESSDLKIIAYISATQPKYISIALHWKELLNSVIQTGSLIRQYYPHIPIIIGGLTASYYPIELISKLNFVDYIVTGDSELPFIKLIKGENAEDIPNIVYKKEKNVIKNSNTFIIESVMLNDISFSRLSYLEDYDLYLKKIDDYLGFPILIGRGCIYDCEYCGGSKSAFKKHSERTELITRNVSNIIEDICYLNSIYGCNHILLSHVNEMCKLILKNLLKTKITKDIRIDVEIWDNIDKQTITLHKQVSKKSNIKPNLILTNKENNLHKNFLNKEYISLCDYCHVDIFMGYFTSSHKNIEILFKELFRVHIIRKSFIKKNLSVHFFALSTDPASLLSETNSIIVSNLSLANINQAILFDRNLSNNILLHYPKLLTMNDQQLFQRILFLSDLVFYKLPFIYWLLTEYFSFETFLKIIEHATDYYFYETENVYYELSTQNTILALNSLKISLQINNISELLINELFNIHFKYEVSKRLKRLYRVKNHEFPSYLTLNRDRIFLSRYNFEILFNEFVNKGIINKQDVKNTERENSLYIFFDNEIKRLPIEEYNILGMFDGINSNDNVAQIICDIKGINKDLCYERIKELYTKGILISK